MYTIYMRAFILSVILLLSISEPVLAEEINAGFVQGLWYSSESVFAGNPTRVYVALRNNTEHDLTGTVRFTDNGKRIGSAEISALSGRLVEAWVDWTPTEGEHALSATLTDAELHVIGEAPQPIDITSLSANDALRIDSDTDKDNIGDATDTDDDNDGVSDGDEKARGSNPLIANPKEKKKEITEKTVPETNISTTPETLASDGDEKGLEKYVDEGTADSLLTNVTEKVEQAKESLDAYREGRNTELYKNKNATTVTETTLGTYTTNTATITRSHIETKNTLLSSFISGVATLLQNIYTFVLWGTSRALSYPALIQFLLLVGILYMFYRTARRLGRRPGM